MDIRKPATYLDPLARLYLRYYLPIIQAFVWHFQWYRNGDAAKFLKENASSLTVDELEKLVRPISVL